jgi:hypothetical protein
MAFADKAWPNHPLIASVQKLRLTGLYTQASLRTSTNTVSNTVSMQSLVKTDILNTEQGFASPGRRAFRDAALAPLFRAFTVAFRCV